MKHSQYFSPIGRGVEHSPRQDFNGFTLAEVLITLGIIGVVAAMTIPTLIQDYNQRSWNTGATVFNRKLGEALKVMNSQSSLAGFATTQDFVNELSKHIKITNTCDSDELTNCFTSEIFTTGDTIDTTKLKAAKNLNKDGNYGTETIGVQFADGVTALVAYNPRATQDPYSNQVVNVTGSGKSVGLGTDALAILYDVSGAKSPNSYGNDKDIRGVNVSINVGADILNLGLNRSKVDCSNANAGSDDYNKYCGSSPSGTPNDYWAGAQKACSELGMHLPTIEELDALYARYGEEGIPTYGSFWSSSEDDYDYAYYYTIDYYDPGRNRAQKSNSEIYLLCVGN